MAIGSSGWQERANARRDARQEKPAEEPKPKGAKKDTKRWCGGKVGREHQTTVTTFAEAKGWSPVFADWQLLCCSVCGKELDRWMPVRNPLYADKNKKPEWAK